ncbi:MAG: TIGR03915 family putative DNA repair protein [Siphonobacter aquaeclarae]|nr:TIGR03915 family putative DNA repair protein [Siphonobacter aquaeclarae]
METYLFDGSLEGFLTLIFDWYARNPGPIRIQTGTSAPGKVHVVRRDAEKAQRVASGLRQRLSAAGWRAFCCTFLSELSESPVHLFGYALYIFSEVPGAEKNYSHDDVLYVRQIASRIEREMHQTEAHVRFQQSGDGVLYATVNPRFNVLPLLARHFSGRYAHHTWIIYDIRRNYGLYYDKKSVKLFRLEPAGEGGARTEAFTAIWQTYLGNRSFQGSLAVKNLPQRFWSYLAEMQEEA